MRLRRLVAGLAAIILGAGLLTAAGLPAVAARGPRDLPGNGAVSRTVLTAAQLQSGDATGTVASSAFGLPAGAANPRNSFEGALTVANAGATGGFTAIKD